MFVLALLRKVSLSARLWIISGLACFGMSAFLGYHQDQVSAVNALQAKVPPPPELLIQNFSDEQDSNFLNEARLIAELGLDDTVTIDIGTRHNPDWVRVTPVYAVGDVSLPFAEQYVWSTSGLPRRPLARSDAGKLAVYQREMAALATTPLAFVVTRGLSVNANEAKASDLQVIGEGANGPLVKFYGLELERDHILTSAKAAFDANGLSVSGNPRIFAPYPLQKRAFYQSSPEFGAIKVAFDWLGLLLTCFGLAMLFSIFPSLPRRVELESTDLEDKSVPQTVFEPIVAQSELKREEHAKESARRRSFGISRLASR